MPKATWGGKRAGAGRPPLTKARCYCGRYTMAPIEALENETQAVVALREKFIADLAAGKSAGVVEVQSD